MQPVPKLVSLNMSDNLALSELVCCECPNLVSLDVLTSSALTTLKCTNCPSLASLNLAGLLGVPPSITSLDLSQNKALIRLCYWSCPKLDLFELDLSHNPALIWFNCVLITHAPTCSSHAQAVSS